MLQLVVATDGRDVSYVGCASLVDECLSEKAMQITDIKHCCKCHCHKLRTDFSESTWTRDGKQPWCKQCMKLYRAAKKKAKEIHVEPTMTHPISEQGTARR